MKIAKKPTRLLITAMALLMALILVLAGCGKSATQVSKVGVQNGTTGHIWCKENLAPKGIIIKAYPGGQDCFTALAAGEVDAVIIDGPVAGNYTKQASYNAENRGSIAGADTENFGFAFPKGSDTLAAAVNQSLQHVIDNGTYEALYKQFIDDKNAPVMPSKVTTTTSVAQNPLAHVIAGDAKTLTVATDATFAPMEFMSSSNEFQGFDIEIMKAIAKDMGAEIKFVNVPWDALLTGLSTKSGEFDMSASSMTITAEREKTILFSNPYFVSVQALAVPKGSAIKTVDDLVGNK